MFRITNTVKHLIIINVILWVATILLFRQGINLYDLLAFHFPESELFKPWQFISHMFMHAAVSPATEGIIIYHLLFNMFGIWMFGTPLEQMWGRNKFLFFYFSAGIGAVLLQLAFYYYNYNSAMGLLEGTGLNAFQIEQMLETKRIPDLALQTLTQAQVQDAYDTIMGVRMSSMVGASGALYGILVAFAFSFPNAELMLIFLPIPIKAKYFVPLLIGADLFFGFSRYATGIAHFAHVGGAVAGFLMMLYWKKTQFNNNRWN